MKLKRRCFETVFDIQRELQAVLDSIRQMTSMVLLKREKNNEIAVYVPKKTILKVMAAKRKLSQHFFYLVWKLSDSTSCHVCTQKMYSVLVISKFE
jgi:hypothetical protein